MDRPAQGLHAVEGAGSEGAMSQSPGDLGRRKQRAASGCSCHHMYVHPHSADSAILYSELQLLRQWQAVHPSADSMPVDTCLRDATSLVAVAFSAPSWPQAEQICTCQVATSMASFTTCWSSSSTAETAPRPTTCSWVTLWIGASTVWRHSSCC